MGMFRLSPPFIPRLCPPAAPEFVFMSSIEALFLFMVNCYESVECMWNGGAVFFHVERKWCGMAASKGKCARAGSSSYYSNIEPLAQGAHKNVELAVIYAPCAKGSMLLEGLNVGGTGQALGAHQRWHAAIAIT
jgi:hypothetical protein